MGIKIWSHARGQAVVWGAASVLVTATALSGAAYAGDAPPSGGGAVVRTAPSCVTDGGRLTGGPVSPALIGTARPYVMR